MAYAKHQKYTVYPSFPPLNCFQIFHNHSTIPVGTSGSTKVFSHDARARPKRSGLTRLKALKGSCMVANPVNGRQNAGKKNRHVIDGALASLGEPTFKSDSFQQWWHCWKLDELLFVWPGCCPTCCYSLSKGKMMEQIVAD